MFKFLFKKFLKNITSLVKNNYSFLCKSILPVNIFFSKLNVPKGKLSFLCRPRFFVLMGIAILPCPFLLDIVICCVYNTMYYVYLVFLYFLTVTSFFGILEKIRKFYVFIHIKRVYYIQKLFNFSSTRTVVFSKKNSYMYTLYSYFFNN